MYVLEVEEVELVSCGVQTVIAVREVLAVDAASLLSVLFGVTFLNFLLLQKGLAGLT